MLERYGIYLVELQWRNCHDRRPCIVLSPDWQIRDYPEEDLLIALMSGQLDLYNPALHFLIEASRPSFPRTGLLRSTYVAINFITRIQPHEVGKKLGWLPEDMQTELASMLRRYFEL